MKGDSFSMQNTDIVYLVQYLKKNRDLIGLRVRILSVLLSDIKYINAGSNTLISYLFGFLVI